MQPPPAGATPGLPPTCNLPSSTSCDAERRPSPPFKHGWPAVRLFGCSNVFLGPARFPQRGKGWGRPFCGGSGSHQLRRPPSECHHRCPTVRLGCPSLGRIVNWDRKGGAATGRMVLDPRPGSTAPGPGPGVDLIARYGRPSPIPASRRVRLTSFIRAKRLRSRGSLGQRRLPRRLADASRPPQPGTSRSFGSTPKTSLRSRQ